MSDKFIKDPREAAKAGDIVKVKVMAIDVPRKRVGLSMRLTDSAEEPGTERKKRDPRPAQGKRGDAHSTRPRKDSKGPANQSLGQGTATPNSAFANAFAKALDKS